MKETPSKALRRVRRAEPCPIGELTDMMVGRLKPAAARCESVRQAWQQLLPEPLRCHCWLGGLSAGSLTVVVDAPSYMYELRLCSTDLLKELGRVCPGAGVRRLRLVLGRAGVAQAGGL